MPDFRSSLAQSVRTARTQRHLTQEQLAGLIGIEKRTIIKIENGKGNPTMEVLFPLIRVLEIDPWEIFFPDLAQSSPSYRKLQLLLKDCDDDEIESLLDVIKSVLDVLNAKSATNIE
jgi:transcriptional regulator with XRE-family HTH domain